MPKTIGILSIWLASVFMACGGDVNQPPSTAELIQMGWNDFQAGNYSEAEQNFTNALLSEPENVEASSGLGWAFAFLKDYTSAIDIWEPAAEKQLTQTDIQAGLCLVYQVQSDYEACIAAGEAVVKNAPAYSFKYKPEIDFKTIRGTMAAAYYGQGDFTNAAAQLDAADPLNAPHSTDAKVLLEAIMAFLGLK